MSRTFHAALAAALLALFLAPSLARADEKGGPPKEPETPAPQTDEPVAPADEAAGEETPKPDRTAEVRALVAELMFEVGAEEVYPGVHGVPEVLRSVDEVAALRRPGITRADLHMVASHLFGTAVAGRSARDSVVGPSLEAHALRGLYVMDASVFPTNLGVNPQHSIMGVVHRASAQLANQERAGRWRWAS